MVEAPVLEKPRLRGWFHEVAFFVTVPAGVVLVLLAPNLRARLAGIVYVVALAALFGTSAAYHRIDWSPRALRRMKRADHSMIFLLIAGTYTPFALLLLRGNWSIAILAIVWTGALAGIALKIARVDDLHALTGFLYIGLGWLALIMLPQLVRGLSNPALALLLAGGLVYTLGAIVLATRRPDPRPAVLGYHEIWHAMTIIAGACHYAVILMLFRALA